MARDILIHRDIPIINQYVQVIPNLESEKTHKHSELAVTELEAQMDFNANPERFIRGQRWIRLPGVDPSDNHVNTSGDPIDPSDLLRQ